MKLKSGLPVPFPGVWLCLSLRYEPDHIICVAHHIIYVARTLGITVKFYGRP